MYSSDGVSWTAASSIQQYSWKSVTFGNGKFVAVSDDGDTRSMYSSDGISWTLGSGVPTQGWQSVVYGTDRFVAVANSGDDRAMYSTDGINWSETQLVSWNAVTFGNGRFLAVSSNGSPEVMYSSDAVNWNTASAASSESWVGVTYGDGKFVAVANSGSGNRVMWSFTGVGTTQPIYSNAPSNQTYYANSGPDKAFNGLLTLPGLAGAAPEWNSFTMDLSAFNLKGDIKVQMLTDEGSNTVGTWGYNNLPIMQHYGIDGVHNEYGDIYDLGVIELNSIQAGNANQMLAIYLNDQMLIDGGPALNTSSAVLTFADDTDLSLFTAEDAVRQDANYTPVTSAITAVASTSSSVPTWSSVSLVQNK